MFKKSVSVMLLIPLLIGLTLTFDIQPVEASGTIYIKADGSVDPPTAPISSVDNITYSFTDNIYDGIVVERSNIIVDGNGYTLQGPGSGYGFSLHGINNVTINNTEIKAFGDGIHLEHSSNNNICGNTITSNSYSGIDLDESSNNIISVNNITANNQEGIELFESSNNILSANNITANNWQGIMLWISSNNIICVNNITANEEGIELCFSSNNIISVNNITANNWRGIELWESSYYNTIHGNNIKNNWGGIDLEGSSNNTIYHNNFVDNDGQVDTHNSTNVWDDGYPSGGNYWSDYGDRYPYAQEINESGIWDTPYVIDAENQDNYPLMTPYIGNKTLPQDIEKVEEELKKLAIKSMLDEIKDETERQEVEELLKELEQAAKKGAKALAKNVAEKITKKILKIFGAGKFTNVMWFVWMEAGKLGSAIGKWMATTIKKIMQDGAIGFFQGFTGTDLEGEIIEGFTPCAFSYVIDWQVLIVDTKGNPVSSKYKLTLHGNPGGNIPIPIKGKASTNKDGYNYGKHEMTSRTWPSRVEKAEVEGYKIIEICSKVEVYIKGGICEKGSFPIFRVIAKIKVEELNGEKALELLGLSLASTVKGYVVDNVTKSSIPYAFVSVSNDTNWGNSAVTDESGYYEMQSVAGNLSISSWTTGYYYTEKNFTITETEVKWMNLTLKKLPTSNSTMRGYVRDAVTNKPITYTSISIYGYDSEGYWWNNYTWTNGEGYYNIRTISGNLSVYLWAYGFYHAYENVTIEETATIWKNLTLQFIPDVSVMNVEVSKTVVGQGRAIAVNATVKNGLDEWGTPSETFDVAAYANTTLINQTQITLSSGNSTTVTFTWNTTGFAKGNYTITAEATPVPGETETTDNIFVADEEVCVSIPGDVDADGDVDLYDAVKLLVIYGVKKDNPKYDPNCDIDGDGDIDLYDAVILLTHYGQKDP